MTIKVGDRLPAGSLSEYIEVESAECKIGPNEFKIDDLTRGKKVVLFGLPGAFTPTCSAKHVPGYVANYDKLKAKGVSDILCMSVNDAFVMGAWAKDQKAGGKVRLMGDGSAAYTKALGSGDGPRRTRHGRALPALLGADRRWRRENAQHRGAGQVRGVRCRHDAQATRLKPSFHPQNNGAGGRRFLLIVAIRNVEISYSCHESVQETVNNKLN